MSLSNLFKDRAYVFPHSDSADIDYAFAKRVLYHIKPTFQVEDVLLTEIYDDYDVFLIREKKRGVLNLKVSLSDPEDILATETSVLKSTDSVATPHLLAGGSDCVGGEDILYLLTYVGEGESLRNMGRGAIFENRQELFRSYFSFAQTRPVRRKYQEILNSLVASWDIEKNFPSENLQAFKEYTNYQDCREFLKILIEQILRDFAELGDFPTQKCHGNLSLDSVFCDGANFYFDSLSRTSMGHPFIDFADFILDAAIDKEQERKLLNEFCNEGKIEKDYVFYGRVYNLALRKKLVELVISYLKEVYLYDSYRYEKIINVSDTFSHLYNRFRKISIFEENRHFIMKTITEPILGVKA